MASVSNMKNQIYNPRKSFNVQILKFSNITIADSTSTTCRKVHLKSLSDSLRFLMG